MSNLKLVVCIFLAGSFLVGCDLPAVFFEEEARRVVDDVVDEEERLHPYPAAYPYAPVAFPGSRIGRYQSSSNSLENKRRSVRIEAGRPRP
jgi:hypothetical protein